MTFALPRSARSFFVAGLANGWAPACGMSRTAQGRPRPTAGSDHHARTRITAFARATARRHPFWAYKTAHRLLRRAGLGHRPQAHPAPVAGRGPATASLLPQASAGEPPDTERLAATRSSNVWALDFQFDETPDRRLKLANIVDEHTREALAMRVGRLRRRRARRPHRGPRRPTRRTGPPEMDNGPS